MRKVVPVVAGAVRVGTAARKAVPAAAELMRYEGCSVAIVMSVAIVFL
jgi:hypothetical protein